MISKQIQTQIRLLFDCSVAFCRRIDEVTRIGVERKADEIDGKSRSEVRSRITLLANLLEGFVYGFTNFKLENEHSVHMACNDIGASVLHI